MEAATGPRPMADGLSAAGLTARDIRAHLLDLYGLKVSPDLISRVTDAVDNGTLRHTKVTAEPCPFSL